MSGTVEAPARTRAGPGPDCVVVRRGTVRDLAVVLELRFALLHEHAGNPMYARLRRDARRRAEQLYTTQLESSSEVTFLAESRGRVVGILRCLDAQGSPLLHPTHYGYIASVYVRPEVRRCGALRALMRAAEEWSEDRGITELRLHNAADSALANEVWSSLGFEPVEVLRLRPLRRPDGGG